MDFDYKEYERQQKEMEKTNEKYLALFVEDLTKAGLSQKTISRHVSNLEFYLNDYLLYYDDLYTMEQGAHKISSFLGYFFIRKCLWSTPSSIRTYAASLKKFYKCMMQHGKIGKDAYDELCSEIKENMEFWISDCAQYNDIDMPSPFSFSDFF